MRPFSLLKLVFFYFIIGCSGVDYIDDYVPPTVRIINPVQSLTVGSEFQFEARYFNVIGEPTNEVVFFGKVQIKIFQKLLLKGKQPQKRKVKY